MQGHFSKEMKQVISCIIRFFSRNLTFPLAGYQERKAETSSEGHFGGRRVLRQRRPQRPRPPGGAAQLQQVQVPHPHHVQEERARHPQEPRGRGGGDRAGGRDQTVKKGVKVLYGTPKQKQLQTLYQ